MTRGHGRWLAAVSAVLIAGCGGDESTREPPPAAPLGGLKVSWALVDAAGAPVACSALGADVAQVRIGAEPREVDCRDATTTFVRLLAGRYPVVVTLHVGPVEVAREVANVEVVSGMTAEAKLTFEVEPRRLDSGRIRLRWRIDDQPPQTRCGEIGASTMHIVSEVGSIEMVDVEVPCVDAEATILDLRPGGYTFRMRLEEPDGTLVVAQLSDPVQLEPASTAQPAIVHLLTMATETGKILAEYTVNATVAAAGCLALDATDVRMTVWVPMMGGGGGQRTETGTSTCGDGQLLAEGFNTEFYSVRIDLLDFFGVSLTSTTVEEVWVQRGATSTVTVDLTP